MAPEESLYVVPVTVGGEVDSSTKTLGNRVIACFDAKDRRHGVQ